MKNWKIKEVLALTILLTAWISHIPITALAQQSTLNFLQTCGIVFPIFGESAASTSYSFKLGEFSQSNLGNYLTLSFDGFDGRISIPGYPSLPYDVQCINVPGYVKIDEIGISAGSISYENSFLSKKVLPAHNPLFYNGMENQTITYEEDANVYSKNSFFPGQLIDYYVAYGANGTTITIHLYPLQYNPATSELISFKRIDVLIKYHVEMYDSPSEKMVIITTSELNASVTSLVEFYNNIIGLPTEVKTTEQIYSEYSPAENITAYTGFYVPYFEDELYSTLISKYNWTLALKIISYINDSNPQYVLIVGGADVVPPSFYYQSKFLLHYSSREGWIPTDYFYASIDYDLLQERFVGRIPFSNSATVQKIVNKILSWYDATWPIRPEWMRNLVMTGGYPFGLTFMFGESLLSNLTRQGYTQMFNTTLLTRTDRTYNRTVIQNLLQNGETGWLSILCHGSGTEIGDYLVANGSFSLEILASTSNLLGYGENYNLPVVTSVSCDNGVWDDALLSPEFTPPSFGEALLMSNASGIAYIGSGRTAFEVGVCFSFDNGLLNVESYGAATLHTLLTKAYNNFMGTRENVSLGEIFAKGLEDYVTTMLPSLESQYGAEVLDYAYANIFMLNIMGDPALLLPVYNEPFSNEKVSEMVSLEPDALMDSELVGGGLGMTEGFIPFYKLQRNTTVQISGYGEKASIRIIQTYFSGPSLFGYDTIAMTEAPFIMNSANLTVTTNSSVNGLLLFKIKIKGVEARFYIFSAGVTIEPEEATPGSMVNVEGYGLNIVQSSQVILTVGGWNVTSLPVPSDGHIKWSFVVPLFNPSTYRVGLCFTAIYSWIYIPAWLIEAFQCNLTVLPLYQGPTLELMVAGGSQYEPEDTVTIRIATLLNGLPVDANLTVKFIKPSQVVALYPQKIATGEYKVEFSAPLTPATYFVSVKAEVFYSLPAFNATAYRIHSFVVTTSFEELKTLINSGHGSLQYYLEQLNVTLVQVSDKVVNIQTTLGVIEGYIVDVNGTTVTILSKLGNISLTLEAIQRLVNDANDEVIAEIETMYGSLNLTLSNINGTIVQVSGNTVEIRTMLGTIQGNITDISNGIATIQTNVGNIKVATDKITQELPFSINYSIATLVVSIIIAALVATLLWLMKKTKPL